MPLLNPEYVLRVLLVFVRVGGLLVAAPFFGQTSIPVRVRILLGVLLAYSLAGFATGPIPAYAANDVGLVLALLVEAATGLLLGFTAHLIFWAINFAGSVMGYQMALSLAQTFNPMSGTSSNPLGQIMSYTFLLAFLLVDGHHFLIEALVRSFEVVPLGAGHVAAGGPSLLTWMGDFFRIAFRLSAPFLVVLFMTDAALGIFARLIPQANLFTLSLPAKLLVGIGVFYVFIQAVFPYFPVFVERINDMTIRMLAEIAPL